MGFLKSGSTGLSKTNNTNAATHAATLLLEIDMGDDEHLPSSSSFAHLPPILHKNEFPVLYIYSVCVKIFI